MGKMICPKHGGSPFDIACSHAGEQIDNGDFPKGYQFAIVGRIFVCNACAERLDIEKYRRLHDEGAPADLLNDSRWHEYFDAWAAAHDALEPYRIICAKCADDVQRKQKPEITA